MLMTLTNPQLPLVLTTCSPYAELPEPCFVLSSHTRPLAPAPASVAVSHPWHSSDRAPAEDTQTSLAFPPPWARSWISARSADCCHCWALEMTETKTRENSALVKILHFVVVDWNFDFPRHDVTSQPFNFTNTHPESGAMLPSASCVSVHSKWK